MHSRYGYPLSLAEPSSKPAFGGVEERGLKVGLRLEKDGTDIYIKKKKRNEGNERR